MGVCSSRPKWPLIKYVYNANMCYLTDPPTYSRDVVVFQDGTTNDTYTPKQIIAELKRQNKYNLWEQRLDDPDEREITLWIHQKLDRLEN